MIRLGQWLSLIFFVCFCAGGCSDKADAGITIIWQDKQATGIAVSKTLLQNDPLDTAVKHLQVRVENSTTAMLGGYKITDDHIEFKPLIPLTNGKRYLVLLHNDVIGNIEVPDADTANRPMLVAVYPTTDTLPENLLKMYLQFSSPMREGEALQHITLLDHHQDTVPDIFLDLQPELWNKERTILTVWLDPGRIKRNLIPNQQMGNPLQQGKRYTLAVAGNWQSTQGSALQKAYTKQFVVGTRDSSSPQPDRWSIHLPLAGTNGLLTVQVDEPLDYFLLEETIRIADETGNGIAGTIVPSTYESGFVFRPQHSWQPGRYRMQVASYLEDLAGNNLNRLFDRDITTQKPGADKNFFERVFIINK